MNRIIECIARRKRIPWPILRVVYFAPREGKRERESERDEEDQEINDITFRECFVGMFE